MGRLFMAATIIFTTTVRFRRHGASWRIHFAIAINNPKDDDSLADVNREDDSSTGNTTTQSRT
jgi:hypothetical protein